MADQQPKNSGIMLAHINEEMKTAYLDYAMSVIVSRALPDVRDGLKPVHRRILYAMYKTGLMSTARFSKSSKVVGEVLGKYHPHGDSSVYEAIVRMAQEFSMRYPLIKGQGNFGSIDGDPPAAMRYTEVKLAKIAEEMIADIEKETVPFIDNYDGQQQEPVHLPAKLPNLLLMGAEGIAVGMATKIPPHNLNEIINAIFHLIDSAKKPTEAQMKEMTEEMRATHNTKSSLNSAFTSARDPLIFDATIEELLTHIKGPDFPTGGIIYGAADIKQVYATGRGKIMVRGVVEEEDLGKGKTAIVITQLPYQVNKANLVAKVANLVIDKKIQGISDLRDESDGDGIRVVIELKRDATYRQVLNNLFKHTELQTSFPANMVALVDGVPQTLSLKSILEYYVRHRVDVVRKRSEYELAQAKHRAHILEGYLIALDNIDEVINIIRKSQTEAEAKEKLMKKFKLSEIQSQAILDMQLKRLTGLERDKIEEELKILRELIAYLEDLIKDVFKILKVIKDELKYLSEKYGDERRTKVIKSRPGEISEEELIENKEVIVVLTKEGYIKQVARETFKVQQRGGKGVAGIETKETDNVYFITTAMSHDYMLFFTNQGRVFQTRVWDVPQGSRTSKGKAIVNLLNIRPDERITSVLTYDAAKMAENKNAHIVMVTKGGTVKKTPFSEYSNIRSNGIIAIKLDENDELLWVRISGGSDNVILATKDGKAIVFKETEVRTTGRSSMGVRGIETEGSDEVVSADVFNDSEFSKELLVMGERGVGKKTKLSNFRGQHRAGKGVKVASVDAKMGRIAFAQIIQPEVTTIIITSAQGHVVKIELKSVPSLSRQAKGVILMRFSSKEDKVTSATLV